MNQILSELKDIKELLQLPQPVFTLRQFCKFADISKDYVYKLTSSGRLKFYRPFGKKIYIDREDAIEILKQNLVKEKIDINRIANNHFLKSKTKGYGYSKS